MHAHALSFSGPYLHSIMFQCAEVDFFFMPLYFISSCVHAHVFISLHSHEFMRIDSWLCIYVSIIFTRSCIYIPACPSSKNHLLLLICSCVFPHVFVSFYLHSVTRSWVCIHAFISLPLHIFEHLHIFMCMHLCPCIFTPSYIQVFAFPYFRCLIRVAHRKFHALA